MTILIILIAPRAGKLSDRIGSRWLVGGGMTLLSIMLLYYSRLGAHATLLGDPARADHRRRRHGLDDDAVDRRRDGLGAVDKAGVGSAVLNSMRQVGGSLGIAVMGAIVASGTTSALQSGLGPQLAFLRGFHDALRVAALLAFAGAIVAVAMIRKNVHAPTRRPSRRRRSSLRDADPRQADRRRTAAGGARHRLPRVRRVELPGRDDCGDRAGGGHLGADPLPALRLQARPLSRVPRRGLARPPRARGGGDRRSPETCLGAVSDAFMAKRQKIRLIDLWIQALNEAADDPVIAKALREQIQEVHAFFAGLIEDGQARGVVAADRDPRAEAWIFVAGGLLVTIDQRLGNLLDGDLERVRHERRRWMHV